jgi:hypothetical protein
MNMLVEFKLGTYFTCVSFGFTTYICSINSITMAILTDAIENDAETITL